MSYHRTRRRPFGDGPIVPGARSDVRSPTRTSSDVRSPTRTSTEVRSPTSTSTEVRSPTSTSTEVRSPTSTSTDAYTSGNITVTGGAGAGAYTTVNVYGRPNTLTPETRAEHGAWWGRRHDVKMATPNGYAAQDRGPATARARATDNPDTSPATFRPSATSGPQPWLVVAGIAAAYLLLR